MKFATKPIRQYPSYLRHVANFFETECMCSACDAPSVF